MQLRLIKINTSTILRYSGNDKEQLINKDTLNRCHLGNISRYTASSKHAFRLLVLLSPAYILTISPRFTVGAPRN